jgi:hypothetical protein
LFMTFAAGLKSGQTSKQAMEHAIVSILGASGSGMDDESSIAHSHIAAVSSNGARSGGNASRVTPMSGMKKISTPIGASSRVASPLIGIAHNVNGDSNGNGTTTPLRTASPIIRGISPIQSTSSMNTTMIATATAPLIRPGSFSALTNNGNGNSTTTGTSSNHVTSSNTITAPHIRAGAYAVAGGITAATNNIAVSPNGNGNDDNNDTPTTEQSSILPGAIDSQ